MKHRKIQMNQNYLPLSCNIGDEIYPNGIFHFNITRIAEHIQSGSIKVELETIELKVWFKHHFHSRINEEHLLTVDVNKPLFKLKSDLNV
ncbi:hypothetical protein [Guptibacillus hwajinpoensis]|uniref:Uncharacterized protein n=1 Tax=Guptibacillus hwajinpoensis TaxID=208199 RepID=A0A0J6CUM7_9BACL|nr:hypothetical protein [Alkalihalobacillus macyae]KMM36770.1 hypothetical protein AB986_12605 [Alkalihalobacillus macyae]